MDRTTHERARQALHGVVSDDLHPRGPGWSVKPLLLAMVAVSLVAGISGGLVRAGIGVPGTAVTSWIGQALLFHAALMICGFLGTVIGIERAVAVKLDLAFLAPVASGAGGLCLLTGPVAQGRGLLLAASLIFVVVNVVIVHRQRAAHTILLLVAAIAWLAGNLLFALGDGGVGTLAWWFTFLVLTIAAERLEMTRLMRRRPAAIVSFHAIVSIMLAGAAWSCVAPVTGGLLYGAALAALAAWLAVFDVARCTVHAQGLSRYMAVCLLGGYAWLMVAGVAWVAMALGWPTRDIALHALGLGFVVSMMMGHAPVILPALTRVKMQFGVLFYVPLAALHLSLVLRLGGGWFGAGWYSAGVVLNAAALALFVATALGGVLAWRLQHGPARIARRAELD